MSDARNNAANTRNGRPFARGNPGRPRGARHKTTLAVEALLDGEAEGLTRKAVELALTGDVAALRLCLDRIAPTPKGRRIALDLPAIASAADVLKALAVLIEAVGSGVLTPDEAATLAGVLEAKRKAIETVDIEARLSRLEATKGK